MWTQAKLTVSKSVWIFRSAWVHFGSHVKAFFNPIPILVKQTSHSKSPELDVDWKMFYDFSYYMYAWCTILTQSMHGFVKNGWFCKAHVTQRNGCFRNSLPNWWPAPAVNNKILIETCLRQFLKINTRKLFHASSLINLLVLNKPPIFPDSIFSNSKTCVSG